MYTVHTAGAAVWAGSVLFVVLAVLPLAMDGDLPPEAFGSTVSKLRWVTRIAALATFLTGGHLAGTLYTAERLTGTTSGYLVLAMLALWLGLAAVVEVGSARALRGTAEGKIREPARDARPFYLLAGLLAVGLLLVAGVLGAPLSIL